MGGSVPTLGYPSRTDAVLALRRQGRTTREIAQTLGIEMKTVAALECSAARRGGSTATNPRHSYGISLGTRQRLRPHAARRGMTVDHLIIALVDQVAEADLVDTVLDDMEAFR